MFGYFSPGRNRFKLLVLVVVLIGGWFYNRYFSPQLTTYNNALPTGSFPGMRLPRRSTPGLEPAQQSSDKISRRDVVIKVIDGDTVKLRDAGSVRLIGVDCPEKSQPGGREATAFATRALLGKTIEYELCAKQQNDRYGRGLGFIFVNDSRGRRVLFNAKLIQEGFARVYSLRPCAIDQALWNRYYEDARRARRGLFATLSEVPDAASYRRNNRK